MKKSMLFWSIVLLVVFPAYLCAQESKDSIIVTNFGEVRASKDLVPAKVKEAVLNDFGENHKPIAWVSNNSPWVITNNLFNDYEWQQSTDAADRAGFSYAFSIKSNNGSTLGVVYTSEGKRISSREYLKNFKPDRTIVLALQNSEYKDWELKKASQLIKVSSDGSEKQHYAIVVKKGKEKKTIHFDENSRMLAVETGDHRELADLDR